MDESLETFVPLVFRRRGVQRVASDDRDVYDVTLIDGLARAFYWQHLLDTGAMASGSAIARAENRSASVSIPSYETILTLNSSPRTSGRGSAEVP